MTREPGGRFCRGECPGERAQWVLNVILREAVPRSAAGRAADAPERPRAGFDPQDTGGRTFGPTSADSDANPEIVSAFTRCDGGCVWHALMGVLHGPASGDTVFYVRSLERASFFLNLSRVGPWALKQSFERLREGPNAAAARQYGR